MRTFDYGKLPQKLLTGALGDANALLFEDRGKLQFLKQLRPELLEELSAGAFFDNVDASAHIDGIYVDAARVTALLAGDPPQNETESQIAGYAAALRRIVARADTLDLSTGSIIGLYETLYSHRKLGTRSRYRKKDFMYVQVDGHMQAMPVSPITAFETPLVLGGACDSLASTFRADGFNAAVLAAVFTVDFLCIRPFDEGNGRIARLFAMLVLQKAGFDVFRYLSVDRLIEQSAMAYYDALNACVEKWDRGFNTYEPFVTYWLDVLHRAYARLFALVDARLAGGGAKSERVRAFALNAQGPVSKREILAALPDVSEATVEAVLGKMLKEGS
ncbi:MAG: Fic family protein, partial [Eggerthellaceae bacterium]|nr:Fic family protein [Eggerthellaceae bacterium]